MATTPTSPSAGAELSEAASPSPTPNATNREIATANPVDATAVDAFQMPTETEIYLLPDGQVVVADLPAELLPLLESIGQFNISCSVGEPDSPSEQ